MKIFREACLSLALILAPLALMVACDTIPSPAQMGCSREESTACKLVAAGLILNGAAQAVERELDRATISPAEATRIIGLVEKGRDALVAARAVATLENATTVERLAALDAILAQILREQLIKAGS